MNSTTSPLETIVKGLSDNGVNVQLQQRLADGSMVDAKPQQLLALNTQSRVATTSQALKDLSPELKLQWALEMKEFANLLYKNNRFGEALEKYVDSLSASDFGSSESRNGNVDDLVVPVLCNMAACCLRLNEWGKCVRFCDQALALRPKCAKALMRKGIAFVNIGEYEMAISFLRSSLDNCESSPDSPDQCNLNKCNMLNESDKQRVEIFLIKASKGRKLERKSLQSQKKSLEKGFASSKIFRDAGPNHDENRETAGANYLLKIFVKLFEAVILFFGKLFEKLFQKNKKL